VGQKQESKLAFSAIFALGNLCSCAELPQHAESHMKTAVLFSGGKDSTLALSYALKESEVQCLITVFSENPESYMFHIPNILFAEKQAEAIGLPILIQKTKGEKEKELADLERALHKAKKQYGIQAVYTGAVASVYQASRIQKLCNKVGIQCINPLWKKDQLELLHELIQKRMEVILVGVFAEGLQGFLGRKIDAAFIEDMKKMKQKHFINPAGEGGEFESFVLDAPFFKKRIEISKSHINEEKEGGRVLVFDGIELVKKKSASQ
jgi:diphthine-ammonia ligase